MSKKPLPADPAFEGRTDAPHARADIDIGRPIVPAAVPVPAAPTPVLPAAPKLPTLPAGRLKLGEQAFRTWRVIVPAGTSPDDLTRAGFWKHDARHLSRDDIVQVVAEDRRFFATLFVRFVDKDGAAMNILSGVDLPDPPAAAVEGYEVSNIPGSDFVVTRRSDGARVATGLPTQSAAYAWLAANAGRV